MVRWLRWHCPPDTGFEIRALAVWDRARYLAVTEAPHNTDFHTWMGKKHFLFLSNRRDREPNPELWREKAAVLTTTLGPPPWSIPRNAQSIYITWRRAVYHVTSRSISSNAAQYVTDRFGWFWFQNICFQPRRSRIYITLKTHKIFVICVLTFVTIIISQTNS